jgi:hypothetical protein
MMIDHIDNLNLTDNQVRNSYNELHSLDYLAEGLKFLYDQVQKLEAEVIKRVGKDKRVCLYGNAPTLKGVPHGLVACAFHWYAVTVCNYVKMVGWLEGGDSNKARQYTESVLPQVYLWRHKVGAHFARHTPKLTGKNKDTVADLAMSAMFPIAFINDAFYASPFKLSLRQSGRPSTSQSMQWSLTHTHRELIPRYWPGSTPKEQG